MLRLLRLLVIYLSSFHYTKATRQHWFLTSKHFFSTFCQHQFQCGLIPITRIDCFWLFKFTFNYDLNYFAEVSQFGLLLPNACHFGRTKGKFPLPVLGVDKFGPFVSLWGGGRAVWAISQGGCDRLGPSGKVRSCPLPDTQSAHLSSGGKKLHWKNCYGLTVLLDITSLLASCSPGLCKQLVLGRQN